MFDKIARQARNATLYSIDGMKYLLSSEFAARLEVYAFFWVLALLLFLNVPVFSLCIALILFLILLAIEALNTAIEVVIDRVSPEISDTGKHAKDLGSFSVMCLIAANFIHLIYVLWNVDWSAALMSAREGWGALFISATFLFVSLYFFTYSGLKKLPRFIFTGYVSLYLILAGLYFSDDLLHSDYRLVKIMVFGSICLAILGFTHDLMGKNRLQLSQNIRQFVRRKTRVGLEAAELDSKRSDPRKKSAILYGSLAVLGALLINPFSQDMIRGIIS